MKKMKKIDVEFQTFGGKDPRVYTAKAPGFPTYYSPGYIYKFMEQFEKDRKRGKLH